jgi:hypothetical protein
MIHPDEKMFKSRLLEMQSELEELDSVSKAAILDIALLVEKKLPSEG